MGRGSALWRVPLSWIHDPCQGRGRYLALADVGMAARHRQFTKVIAPDPIARDVALKRWALPECLHVPIAAVDLHAIEAHVGVVEQVVGGTQPRAVVVRIPTPPVRDARLPIWELPGSSEFFKPLQLWVEIGYSGYRRAYRRAFPSENIDGQIMSHAMNRRTAETKGYRFVRLTPTSRANNSSSALSEGWAVSVHAADKRDKAAIRGGASIQYADLADLMLMADLRLGGGVMELVNEGQRLVTPPK
jgi:hypothetical protein